MLYKLIDVLIKMDKIRKYKYSCTPRVLIVFVFLFSKATLFSQKKDIVVPNYQQEIMNYSLKLGFLNIGDATIKFISTNNCNGAKIHAEAKSSGFVKMFKDIHYKFESCMDTTTGLPSLASRRITEDDFSSLNEVDYFHTLRMDSSVIYSQETDSLVVPKNIFDILTGCYYFRANCITQDLPVGHADTIVTFFIDEVWDLIIRYAGEETIKTKFGMVKCMKFMPVTEVSRFFKGHDDLSIWVTKSGRNIPVRFEINLRVGSLIAEIDSYQAPKK